MVESRPPLRANGFSLVEMMVALVFTLLLMTGMAAVFKSSLSSFYTSGEILSSARRSRMSIDQLGEDLNTAGMYLTNLGVDPNLSAANPSFYVWPNMAILGAPNPAAAGQPTTADQLFFYLDEAFPFTANLTPTANATAGQMVVSGAAQTVANNTYSIDCLNSAYAQQIMDSINYSTNHTPNPLSNPTVIFKDNGQQGYIVSASVNGTVLTVTLGPTPNVGITGLGSTGQAQNFSHTNCNMLFAQLGQMVRYSVQYLQLDPTSGVGIPCLVRDQGTYSPAGFVADQPQQIISENIQGFKVYLSVNAGQTWAGLDLTTASSGASGWTNGILTTDASSLATQLTNAIAVGWTTPGGTQVTNLAGNPDWFRYLPTLVRVDITTRTATQRTEYSTVANTAAYKQVTQSLVFVPRHSGLSLN